MTGIKHTPVLITPIIELLQLYKTGSLKTHSLTLQKYCINSKKPFPNWPCLGLENRPLFVDCTFGFGGYTKQLLKTNPTAHVLALDRDPASVSLAKSLASAHTGPGSITPIHTRFSRLKEILAAHSKNSGKADAIFLDLGTNMGQLKDPRRGFSFMYDGPLDMRYTAHHHSHSPTLDSEPAARVLETATLETLIHIFKHYGEERHAVKLANAIIRERHFGRNLTTTFELRDFIVATIGSSYKYSRQRIHPATRVFQALRIFVNKEMEELNHVVGVIKECLNDGGVCGIVSFHSLEDRVVKRGMKNDGFSLVDEMMKKDEFRESRLRKQFYFKKLMDHDEVQQEDSLGQMRDSTKKTESRMIMVTRKPIMATDQEIIDNPNSRSAKLRFYVKV